MHELTIARSLIELAADHAARNGATGVVRVRVRLGVPWDQGHTVRAGTSSGPAGIRDASTQYFPYMFEYDIDILSFFRVVDCGDVSMPKVNPAVARERIYEAVRAVTDAGAECTIALPRDEHLAAGAVLLLESDRAIVVRMNEERWLTLFPGDRASALELGYFAGNLHWRVKFDHDRIRIALDGPEDYYVGRLSPFLDTGRATRIADD